jgi:hypothetical protein
VIEWLPPKDDFTSFAILAGLAALIVVPWARGREKPPAFESIVLIASGVAGLRAARNMVWLGVAVSAYAPVLLDRVGFVREQKLRVVAALARVAPVLALAGVVRLCFLSQASLERTYPTAALAPLRAALAEHPSARLVASDVLADWVLWRAPEAEGRIELDARLELLDRDQARALGRFLFTGDTTLFSDAELALVSKKDHRALATNLRAAPRANVVWEDGDALLVWR